MFTTMKANSEKNHIYQYDGIVAVQCAEGHHGLLAGYFRPMAGFSISLWKELFLHL